MADVSGSWLGTYWQDEVPTRFEATLLQRGNLLSGNILDDDYLGEAEVSGSVVGRTIQFTKCYLIVSLFPVNYIGTLADDANSMKGTWQIGTLDSGDWEAHRHQDDWMATFQTRLAQSLDVVGR